MVRALLGRWVFVRMYIDEQSNVAKRMAVKRLPDIRFALPDGTVVRQLRNIQDSESIFSELEGLIQKMEKITR